MANIVKKYYSKISPNLAWSFASKAVAAIAFIAIDILLARVLEAELYGKWQQLFSLLTILLYLTYAGLPAAAQAFSAKNFNKSELKQVLSNSLTLQIIFSGITIGIILLLRNQIARIFNHSEYSEILLLAAPFLFIGAVEEYLKNIFVGIKQTKYHFYMNVMSFGLRLVILLILTFFFLDIPTIIFGYSTAMLSSIIVGFIFYRKYLSKIPSIAIPKPIFYKKIFLYSLPIALTLIIALSIPEINIQILGLLTNPTEVAFLSVGKQLTTKLPQIALAVSMGIMPDFAQITSENKQIKKTRFFGILKLNFILYGLISGGLIILSPILIPIIYGSAFSSAILPLQILSLNLFLVSMNGYLSRLLDYHGRASRIAWLMVVVLILNIFFNLLLVPRFGAVGSAFALTISFLPYSFDLYRNARNIFEEAE